MNTTSRSLGRAAVLLPLSLARGGAALTGRRPRPGRTLLHSAVGLLLGALALVAVGVEVLFVLRGLLYGIVDPGPYDHSWGGPSPAGAWLAHAAIGVPFAVAALGLLWLVAALDARLGAHLLRGERPGAWVWPTALAACAGGAVFVVAWIHQL
ncbi:hypothetical protein HUT16_12580 [Kitasatospora sp. NA04385]|uniref:hypothetical protein n=1 Tax=Kitasatospora sp. NA04385 TaxID=2742135 RepID=UPI001591F3AF|nr:hypothetical protein [Kitasatospora sp. NA04385]QKW19784.1 hypothetical protein HUT16_12580 [Kitasatospora sp. NA04385]